jgi:hypothetical protein
MAAVSANNCEKYSWSTHHLAWCVCSCCILLCLPAQWMVECIDVPITVCHIQGNLWVDCTVYVKWLDRIQEWVSYIKTRGEPDVNMCPQTLGFWGTVQECVDLNPLDFYLWGHLKTLVYSATIESEDALCQCIFDACQTICNHPGTFERVQQSMMRHVHAFIVSGGGHFEHLLWIVTYVSFQ